jgi:uncharacterized protein YjbI with pentapeptide repeats
VRIDATLSELTSAAGLQQASAGLANLEGDFLQLVEFLRLDKENDFVFSNLRGVDFTGSDLRGFDFSGADLRGSFGADVLIDHTTVLTNADVEGSCFATYKRERDLFSAVPNAERMYEILKSGDPYEVSEWIHFRFGDIEKSPSILRDADSETATILCQKLLSDDIDLTKRADLFHHLRSITGSQIRLRELLLDIIARHVGNTPILNKFIIIAGDLYKNDPAITQALLTLTVARDARVREISFRMLSRTRFFAEHLHQLRCRFLAPENQSIRQSMLRSAAIKIGRQAVSAVNLAALRTEVPVDQILDYGELLDDELASQIARRMNEREDRIAESFGNKMSSRAETFAHVKNQDIQAILRRQEEVMCSTPVIKLLFATDMPEVYKRALARLKAKTAHRERAAQNRIARAHTHTSF